MRVIGVSLVKVWGCPGVPNQSRAGSAGSGIPIPKVGPSRGYPLPLSTPFRVPWGRAGKSMLPRVRGTNPGSLTRRLRMSPGLLY